MPSAPRSNASATAAGSSVTRRPPTSSAGFHHSSAAARDPSTVACLAPAGLLGRRPATSWSPARTRIWSATIAQGAHRPPRSRGHHAGAGAEQRCRHHGGLDDRVGERDSPALLEDGTRKVSSRPSPPSASGTSSAEHAHGVEAVPHARGRAHRRRSQAARTTAGVHSLARRSRTASRNATWSSDSANLIAGSPRHTLGGDVALDLVRAGVDRAGQGELPCPSLHGPSTLGARARAGRARSRGARCRARDHQSLVRLASAPGLAPAASLVTVASVCCW